MKAPRCKACRRVLEGINKSLEMAFRAPKMCGSPETLEAQVMVLIHARLMLLSDDPKLRDEVYDLWGKMTRNMNRGQATSTTMWCVLQKHNKLDKLPGLLEKLAKRSLELAEKSPSRGVKGPA